MACQQVTVGFVVCIDQYSFAKLSRGALQGRLGLGAWAWGRMMARIHMVGPASGRFPRFGPLSSFMKPPRLRRRAPSLALPIHTLCHINNFNRQRNKDNHDTEI